MKEKVCLRVGDDTSDIKGFTNTHIQCAVDRVAFLGGGTVELSKGTFIIKDSIHLRSQVLLCGQGEKTVLKKNEMKTAKVISRMGFGHFDIIVDTPEIFEYGDGVIIGDDNSGGFYESIGTLVARDGDTWFSSTAHAHDYTDIYHGCVKTLFPVISAIDINDAKVSAITIDGNAENNEYLNSCRGGGFFAHRSNRLVGENITVRNFDGEGFSFQTCDDLTLDGCLTEQCSGNGFHPGSGSNWFHIINCTARNCGSNGLFYCLRVRDSILENCCFEDNRGHGVSIGARDTGHINRNLTIRNNDGAGIYLREGEQEIAPHGNQIINCVIENNCQKDGEAEIVLQGAAEEIQVIGNKIYRRDDRPGILVKSDMGDFTEDDNTITPYGSNAIVRMSDRRK